MLKVTGTAAGDLIVIRLRAGDPTMLEVDAGGDGVGDFRFARSTFTVIEVDSAGGADTLRADPSNGTLPTRS